MQPLTSETLGGFVPAVVTPFSGSGEIMADAFGELVEWLIGNGANGICVAGDNGESWSLTAAERQRLTRLAVDRAAGRVPVIAGAGAATAGDAIRFARAASDGGADGLLLLPQTYVLKASRPELLRRFEAVAKAVPLPIIAYNSPRRTGIELGLADLEALTGVAPIIGLKESSRDFFHHSRVLHAIGGRISMMVGPSHYIFPGLALGARGFIATGPELLGPEAGRIMTLAREKPSAGQARLHHMLTVLYETLMASGTWPAALKAALGLLGQPAGFPRDPVLPLSAPETAKLRLTMQELGLLA
ncbi:MAG: dihydrodipicolinate synthase family protein [Acetobacteraceae bacterium]